MEKMPYRPELDQQPTSGTTTAACRTETTESISSSWREQLPVLVGRSVVLREMRMSDAPSLYALLTTEEVARFISPPPSSVDGFEGFIQWAARQRTAGAYVCFAVTLAESDTAIGIFQVRSTEPGFGTAEWGFALGSDFWGKGVFQESAELVLGFAFGTIGVHRLEARAALRNGRGNAALRKIGARQEGILRKSFFRNGEYLDQALWTVLDEDWRASGFFGAGRMILH
jgi:[ribosomal protein S5]-alanine N-acetyltransferase